MENTKNGSVEEDCPAGLDLENILKELDSLSNHMDQLILQTQLKLCDLIINVGNPDKLTLLKFQEEALEQQQPPPAWSEREA